MEPFLRVLFALLSTALAVTACSSDMDCSLNGVCTAGACVCDPAWIGSDCGALDIRPAKPPPSNGYNLNAAGTSSWCNSFLQDPNTKTTFHMVASEFVNDCSLDSWATTSRVIRATSTSGPQGPYKFVGQLAGTFAHNPMMVYSPADKLYLVYRIGCDNPVTGSSCSHKAGCAAGTGHGEGSTHVHSSPDMINWTDHGVVLDAGTGWETTVTNPGAYPLWSASNPTSEILLAYRGCNWGKGGVSSEHNAVTSGPTYMGPYPHTEPMFPTTDVDEDPYVWRDKRGNFHMLMHGLFSPVVGRHAYATNWNGTWTYGSTVAYTTQAKFTDGTTINYSRRERPNLYLSTDGTLTPLYLANGVQVEKPQSYSLIVPLGDGAAAFEKSLGF